MSAMQGSQQQGAAVSDVRQRADTTARLQLLRWEGDCGVPELPWVGAGVRGEEAVGAASNAARPLYERTLGMRTEALDAVDKDTQATRLAPERSKRQ